ncbi:spore germination protein [Aquibacillus kalidii]|uniref:spore germination protein n=1 Tax=Aquibacillus kalidii TaxID=2762597 RepID=UPI001648293D|nr:spore germination protein [Aquibacillus kalidii]
MPAVVGAIKVISIGSSSIFNVGDVYSMNPYTEAKTFAGGGSFNTGDNIRINIPRSNVTVSDSDTFDQNITDI